MKLLFSLFDRRVFVLCAVIGVLMVGLEYLGIGLILPLLRYTMDTDLAARTTWLTSIRTALGLRTHAQFVVAAGASFAAFFLVKSILLYKLQRRQAFLLMDAHRQLADRVLREILDADYRAFLERSPSGFVGTVQTHTSYAAQCLHAFVMMAVEAVLLVLLLGLALWLNWRVTTALVIGLGLLTVALKLLIIDPMQRLGRQRNEAGAHWQQLCYAVVSAIRDIKIMRLERRLQEEFRGVVGAYTDATAEHMALQVVPKLVGETSFVLAIVAAVVFIQVTGLSVTDNAAALTTFVVVLTRMIPSVHKLYNSASMYKYSYQAMEVLEDNARYLQSKRLPVAEESRPFAREIRLENVRFTYDGADRPALDDVSVVLPKGGFVGVVGRSGSGKSTFLDVFVGLLQADSGRILLDGEQVDPFSSDVIRRHIGYVPQQVTLLDESIGYNISLDPDWPERLDKVRAAARAARVDSFIEGLAESYGTPAGERGVKMSGGQRQRIGIARALYTQPEILVLDEATSAVDAITEKEILGSMDDIVARQTVIFATHRLPAVRKCDRIVVFDGGRVVGDGPHETLLADCPAYRRMVEQDQEEG